MVGSCVLSPMQHYMLSIRGGSDDELDVDDEDFDEENNIGDDDDTSIEEATTSESETFIDVITRITKLLQKAAILTTNAISRSIQAGLDVPPQEDGEMETTVLSKLIDTIQRMWKAAISPESGDDDSSISATDKSNTSETTESSEQQQEAGAETTVDFGHFLSKEYGIADERPVEGIPVMLGGSLADALRVARNKARLLVVFIPSARPDKKKSTTPDHLTIRSFKEFNHLL